MPASDLTILTSDGTNSIYGVTAGGGAYNAGVVFQLSQPVRKWQYEVIYSFPGGGDGRTLVGIHLDNVTGTLYGTTEYGGAFGLAPCSSLCPRGATGRKRFSTIRQRLRWSVSLSPPNRRPTDGASLRHHLPRRYPEWWHGLLRDALAARLSRAFEGDDDMKTGFSLGLCSTGECGSLVCERRCLSASETVLYSFPANSDAMVRCRKTVQETCTGPRSLIGSTAQCIGCNSARERGASRTFMYSRGAMAKTQRPA